MREDSLTATLEKLSHGDAAAVEQVFQIYEPYLRAVVRRQLGPQLRVKFDSVDVVQSVWADLLQGFRDGSWSFTDREQLKAFLVTATRHRFIDCIRRHEPALSHGEGATGNQRAASIPDSEPRPSQVAVAEELWQRILTQCQPAHRQLLELKRQGLPVTEIAKRTGFHKDSIHRILRNLASRLAVHR
jgi:RNA polymerase sigma-70 factor (ECF subfamily)